jgi:hypothetical protein
MSTQKPTNLAQDMREVERASHLLGVKPDELTAKALAAVERRKEKVRAATAATGATRRKQDKGKLVVELPEDEEVVDSSEVLAEDENMELDAIAGANVVEDKTRATAEKIKVKSKVKKAKPRGSLVAARSGGRKMGMDMD